ncbi:MAG: substrate-binding domain-containing protein [Firmicutes bacterium]|nr:substrate-binding domain-containing protein [Bacillota bacterium]
MVKKSYFKIIIAFVAICLLSITLMACNASKDIGVGIYITDAGDAFRNDVGIELVKIFGDEATRRDAGGNQTTQNEQIQNDLNKGLKGILATLPNPDDTLNLINTAKDKDLPLITFSSEPSKLEVFEQYDKVYLVSSNSKDAGVIDAQILERGLFGLSEGMLKDGKFDGLHSSQITPQYVKKEIEEGKLVNNIEKWKKSTIDVNGVPVLETLLVEGDADNWGSTDRTRAALLAVNIFYDVISKAESEITNPENKNEEFYDEDWTPIFPNVPLTELKNTQSGLNGGAIFSGAEGSTGFFSYFTTDINESGNPDMDNIHIYKYSYSGILQYKHSAASNHGGGAAWSDTGSEAAVKNWLGTNGVPDILIGASDQVTAGAVRALNSIQYNEANSNDNAKIIPIVSTDGSAYGVTLLKNNQIWGTAEQSPTKMAEYVSTMMKNLLQGNGVLDGTSWQFDDSPNVNSSGTNGDKEHKVLNKIIRIPYSEFHLPTM